jgi:hypothetical protein
MLTIDIPPGIGDGAWSAYKIYDLVLHGRKVAMKICGDEPKRAKDFIDVIPGVTNLGYGGFYRNMVKRLVPYNTDLASLPDGNYAISMNPHLEAGFRIEDAYPKQKTHFHMPFNTTPTQHDAAKRKLDKMGKQVRIGFYCSSHKHRPDLGHWLEPQWIDMLTRIAKLIPNASFLALGASYDDKTVEVERLLRRTGIPTTSTVGSSDVGTTIETLRGLDYFVSFPSGLSVLCDNLNTPCMYFYWSNVLLQFKDFPRSYADPDNLKSGRHLIIPYLGVDDTFEIFKSQSLPFALARAAARGVA